VENIRVVDLATGITVATVNHDAKIDWLDLNSRGDLVLFRDKRRKLHVYDITSQTRNTLLTYASFATWVPESDVVVAQSRNSMCVWYNIFSPDKVTVRTIKGDVEVRECVCSRM
jgi:intraflagellar transport protein 172